MLIEIRNAEKALAEWICFFTPKLINPEIQFTRRVQLNLNLPILGFSQRENLIGMERQPWN